MLNKGNINEAIVMQVPGCSCSIYIWPTSETEAIISVRDIFSTSLWRKRNCTANDLQKAIEVAKAGVQTGIYEQ